MVVVERLGIRYHKMVGVRRVKVVPKNNQPKAPGKISVQCTDCIISNQVTCDYMSQ